MNTLFGLAAAGEEGAAVWTEEAVGAAVPTLSLLQHPLNLFLFSRSPILLGPRFSEGLLPGTPLPAASSNVWWIMQGLPCGPVSSEDLETQGP